MLTCEPGTQADHPCDHSLGRMGGCCSRKCCGPCACCCCRKRRSTWTGSSNDVSDRNVSPSHAWNSSFHRHNPERHFSEPAIPPSWMDDSKGLFIYSPRKSFEDDCVPNPLPIDVYESQLAEQRKRHRAAELRKSISSKRDKNNLLTQEEYDKAQRRPNTAQ